MIPCPKCGSPMRTTHCSSSTSGVVRRRTCDSCYAVVTSTEIITQINPPHGEGFSMLARKMKAQAASDSAGNPESSPQAASQDAGPPVDRPEPKPATGRPAAKRRAPARRP